MDWSPHQTIIGGKRHIVHTGSIVLCFSRWLFIRFFPDETLERVIQLHEEAFQELGRVPHTMTYDNMTTVGRHIGPGKVWINPTFKRFADQYDFKIIILPPGAKERHGKVERPFHYIEHNFLEGREFQDFQEQGPFSRWVHTHRFTPREEDGAWLEDDIEYVPPLGGLGRAPEVLGASRRS